MFGCFYVRRPTEWLKGLVCQDMHDYCCGVGKREVGGVAMGWDEEGFVSS